MFVKMYSNGKRITIFNLSRSYRSGLDPTLSSAYMLYKSVLHWIIVLLLVTSAPFHGKSQLTSAASLADNNFPPRFTSSDGSSSGSEIVVRVKEGPSSLNKEIYRLTGEDPDGDSLTFGVLGTIGEDILKIENEKPNSAVIYLRKELDRETRDSYSLVLTLTDGKLGKGNFITKSMLIIVEDINDNEPVFRPFRSTVSLSEKTRPGVIETVEAFDQDEGRFGQVLYQLQEVDKENGPKTFSIETVEGKGVISLVGDLDYERRSLYQLKILAIDRAIEGDRHTATATLLVRVEDAEDNPPIFTFVPSVTRIPENLPVRSEVLRVIAVDGDRGVNNAVTYRIVRGGRGLFSINPSNGIVSVEGQLDREESVRRGSGNSAYILEIQATEVTVSVFPPPSVNTEVTIILTDVNDEKPAFKSEEYTAEVSENAQVDMPIRFIGPNDIPQVFDYDQGNNGTFILALEGEAASVFEVTPSEATNEATFVIRVKDPSALDYETVKSLSFNLVAREKTYSTDMPRSSTVPVTVHIKDANDNFPSFDRELYRASIPENAVKGAIVAQIQATDADSGNYGTAGIRYTDIQGELSSKLHLDPITGVISLKTSEHGLDRETISQYYITAEARDNEGHGNRNTVQILLTIEDVNDNRPRFMEDRYEARIYENEIGFQSPVIIKAVDADQQGTPNSQIRYAIVDGVYKDNFTIDARSGRLKVKEPLDFERIKQPVGETKNITLTVRASDLGSPSLFSDADLTVIVYDKNDNSPIFQRSSYAKSIPEDIRDGSMVLQVKAIDGDHSPTNSRVFYRISSGSQDKFVIDPDSGLISVATGANLDPDRSNPKQSLYVLVVTALDGNFGRDQKQSQVIVNITIVDVNNKPPIFIEPGTVSVPEDAPVGFFVTRVAGKDADDRPLLRYSIDYMLSEAKSESGSLVDSIYFKDTFSINPMDGTIRVSKELDRETWDQVKLYLIVEDLAAVTPGQRATALLTVKIADVNDNRPLFVKELFTGAITENAALGTPILAAKADDRDLNKTVYYSLEGRKELLDLVSISHKSGEISVKGKIDRETYSWINLTVRATDSGPSPLSGVSKIAIQVFDENDNNPVFVTSERKQFSASEDAPVGSLIAQVTAQDEDIGPYGKVTYLLDASSSHGKFKIDRDTGSIIVASKLDREEMSSYNLLIQAVDNYEYGFVTGESRRTFQQITVKILDVNDETPIIAAPAVCAQTNEFLPLHDTITVITASDKDDPSTANGRMKFSIIDGNEAGLFDIEPIRATSLPGSGSSSTPGSGSSLVSVISEASARIVSRFSLRAKVGNFSLKVRVEDEGRPPRSSTAVIPICIADINDRNPVFVYPPSNHTIRIPENSTIGSPVIEVKATDDDYGLNSIVNYKLRELPNGHWKTFKIDKQSGLVTLAKTLDRERQRIYELRVEAYDLGEPTSLSTDLDITILVTNVDDFEPEFTEDIFKITFTENLAPGSEVFKIIPTIDKDEMDDPHEPGVKSIPCYYIVGGNNDNAFTLDILSHQLTVTRPLDRENQSSYSLIIQATNDCLKEPKAVDKFDSRDNSLLQVIISVKDVNDNPPKFVKPVFTGGVTTEADFGTVFMSIKAIDADEGANSVVSYYIVGPQKRKLSIGLDTIKDDPFLINRKTGEIGLNFDPRKDMKGYFEFQVMANDSSGLFDTAKVKIYLLREDQRVRFVLRLTPQELRERLEKFRDVLSNITGAIVNVDSYKFHSSDDGHVDKFKTDLYLHFVDPSDNSIMDVNNVLKLIDKNIDYLDQLYKDFNVLVSEPSQNREEILTFDDQLKACLISSTAFLSLLLMLVTCLCINQRNRYERRLKAATASAFGHRDPQLNRTNVPNTNIHADEGSNPIWMTGYDNEWFKDDEQISHNSNGNNSLDENAVSEGSGIGGERMINGPLTPTDSLNESHAGTGSESSTNDKSALCRGVTAGRLTPQNITIPAPNGRVNNNNKKNSAPRLPKNCHNNGGNPGGGGGHTPSGHVSCKNSINTVYISSPYSDQSQYHTNQIGGNNLSIINLETTEL